MDWKMMNGELFKGIASLLWPLIIIFVLLKFRARIDELLNSVKSRKVTLKVGGNEVTLDEATQQQSAVVAELQKQIVELKNQFDRLMSSAHDPHHKLNITLGSAILTTSSTKPCLVSNILWVDDVPKNNSYLIEMMQQRGLKVIQATSTSDGISLLGRQKFDRVISDMGRYEAGKFNGSAGLEFVKAAREIDKEVPIIIYSNSRSVEAMKETLMAAGASDMTSGSTNLLKALDLECSLG